jgi:hypothetical protein
MIGFQVAALSPSCERAAGAFGVSLVRDGESLLSSVCD